MATAALEHKLRNPNEFPDWEFQNLEVAYDAESRSVWMNYKVTAPHHYSLAMLVEAVELRESVKALAQSPYADRWPIRYFVMNSNKPGVFSLGGDLATFSASVRKRDRHSLLTYAHVCIDVMYGLTSALGLPLVTVSTVRGQCFGGGFEGAMATDFLIAEESAKLGVPEVAFNTFPGMGAVTFLKRRVGVALAEQIIATGAAHSAKEMHDFGVVDVLAPDGRLRETALEWMCEGGEERWMRRRALADLRRDCFPITREELLRVVELWVDCSFSIGESDLRHMERLVAAQGRLSGQRPKST
jgi:DSF synthase